MTNCPDKEQIYTSTFTLRQYTTSSDNQDKTVKFQCTIDSFPGITSSLSSSWSGHVRYAGNVFGLVTLCDEKILLIMTVLLCKPPQI